MTLCRVSDFDNVLGWRKNEVIITAKQSRPDDLYRTRPQHDEPLLPVATRFVLLDVVDPNITSGPIDVPFPHFAKLPAPRARVSHDSEEIGNYIR